jgi:hypothetical protein
MIKYIPLVNKFIKDYTLKKQKIKNIIENYYFHLFRHK